jgi:hypothetical protein
MVVASKALTLQLGTPYEFCACLLEFCSCSGLLLGWSWGCHFRLLFLEPNLLLLRLWSSHLVILLAHFWIIPIKCLEGWTLERRIWYEVLYRNSAWESHFFHCLGAWYIEHLRNISRHWFTLSLWPSVCGWYALLMLSVTFNNLSRTFQND